MVHYGWVIYVKKILISAFDIFGNNAANSSQLVLEQLTENQNLKKVLVPTVRQKSFEAPEAFFLMKRKSLSVLAWPLIEIRSHWRESQSMWMISGLKIMRAINLVTRLSSTVDLPLTFQPCHLLILQSRLESLKIPVEISNSAGTFVCNHLMYQVAHYLQNTKPNGFIHLPSTDKMSLEEMTEAITVVINNI